MKALLAICMIVTASSVWSGEYPAANPHEIATVTGKVVEVINVENYTYLLLQTMDGETWAAVGKAAVKVGASVSLENIMVMNNFESQTLNKTFPTILFGNLASATGKSKENNLLGLAFPAFSKIPPAVKKADTADIKVPKAKGENARTVAEINTKRVELKDKTVMVSGKDVKYNPGIMGKNWIHLRDGSGSAEDSTNDILVTSQSPTNIGDIVTAKGIVRTDMNFGAGYVYKVLVEEATLQ